MKRLFLFFLVLATVVPAVSSAGTSRVLPAAYNERTFGGAGRDYTDLATWESDTDTDLVTAGKGEVLTCYADSASYNQAVNLSGATASATLFRVIRAAQGHRGTPTSGVRFVESGSTSVKIFNINEDYSGVYDIAASAVSTASTEYAYAICFANQKNQNKFIGCTAYYTRAQGVSTAKGGGFWIGYYPAVVANCFATDVVGSHTSSGGFVSITQAGVGALTQYLYNCSATGCSKGIVLYNQTSGTSLTVYAKNCIAQGNTTDTSLGGSYTKTLEQTTNKTSGVVFGSDGYHLGKTDSAAKNSGTDLSNDSVFSFNDDIDGKIRRGAWDIGCDEISAQHLPIVQ